MLKELSSYIKIESFQESQKQLIAAKDIQQEGLTLIHENPIEIAVLNEMRSKICNYCLDINKTKLFICSGCQTFYYCSQNCQKKDWTVHKIECKIYSEIKKKKYNLTSQFVMMLRIYLKNKGQVLENFLVNYEQFDEEKIKFFQESAYMLLKLLNEQINETSVQNIVKINMQIYINGFTIQDPVYSYEGLAIGIYNTAHLLNHSCKPNCIQIFNNRQIYIKTLRPIKAGEQLTVSYFDVCRPKQERKKYALQQYMFKCQCERCENEVEEFAIKCQNCKKSEIKENELKCIQCGKEITNEDMIKIKERIRQISEMMNDKSIEYNKKVDLIMEARKIGEMRDMQFCQIISDFIVFSIGKEQYRNAKIFLKKYIKNFIYWYKQELPLLFQKYNELSKLLFFQNELLEAEAVTQKALNLCNKFYSEVEFQEKTDLIQRYQDIKHEIMMSKNN